MLGFPPEGIQAYAEGLVEPEPAILAELSAVTREKTPYPEMKISWYEACVIRMLLRMIGAVRVLEIGTFTGYSALAMAEVLPEHGSVTTLDVDPENTEIAKAFWARSPHGKKITLRLGPAAETLPSMSGPFDACFIDADKAAYPRYWDAVVPLVRSYGLILADNTLADGRVLSGADGGREMAAFNDKIRADARVRSVILTIRDGLTVALKQ
jgi:caffeoyl-CoA O-methyltransferase